VLPGVAVTVAATQGTQTFVTDAQGRFFAPFLTPGTYTVRAELQGSRRRAAERGGQAWPARRAEPEMTVGGLTETVEVTGSRADGDESVRRHRLLREQHRREPAAAGLRHQHRQLDGAAPDPLRHPGRAHQLRQHRELHRSTVTLSNGQQTVTGASVSILDDPSFGSIYRVVRSSLNNVRKTRQDYLSFFAQDVWQIGQHVTLRPGVRYEQQKLIGDVTEQTFDGNWAPRIGATWDPTGTGRAKIFGNYGWFFAKVPNDLAARALSADAGVTRADYFDPSLTLPVPQGTLAAGTTNHLAFAGLSASTFDPEVRSTYSTETLIGAEWEAAPGLSLAAHYTRRRYGRVLEDVGTLPMVAYFLGNVPGAGSVEYFITNPDVNTPVAGNLGVPISFDSPVHEYDAVTLEADRRFANGWSIQSSYRWSRLWGNFEGFFHNDNGQSDPGITSLFDFPTNDPTYVSLGAPLGFRGDIRYLGVAGNGPLPNDRQHQGKIYGNRQFAMGANVGVAFTIESGAPMTAFAANPLYDSSGEIPESPRGQGFETVNGFKKRSPVQYNFDLHGDYGFRFGGRRLVVLADVFNLFNLGRVQAYDYYTEVGFLQENPNFGHVLGYQSPRSIRFGARFEF